MRNLTLLGLVLLLVGRLAAQERTTSPHGSLTTECSVCHQSKSWSTIQVSSQFDHGKLGFPLTGAHGATTCRSCHVSLDFKSTSANCASCHTDNHRGEFGTNCARCHTTRKFDRSRRDGQGTSADAVPAVGQPPGHRLRRLPQTERAGPDAVPGHAHDLRVVPPGQLQCGPESRGLALPDDVRRVSHHRDLERRQPWGGQPSCRADRADRSA